MMRESSEYVEAGWGEGKTAAHAREDTKTEIKKIMEKCLAFLRRKDPGFMIITSIR